MPVGRCMKQIVILFWSMAMKQLHFDNLKFLLCEHDLHLKNPHNFYEEQDFVYSLFMIGKLKFCMKGGKMWHMVISKKLEDVQISRWTNLVHSTFWWYMSGSKEQGHMHKGVTVLVCYLQCFMN